MTLPLSSLHFYSPSFSISPLQQVEPFLCDCVSISKLLAQAIAPFTKDMETPTNLEETKEVLKKHQLKKRRTIDQLQIDELTSQGLKINKLIKQESEERYTLCHCVGPLRRVQTLCELN